MNGYGLLALFLIVFLGIITAVVFLLMMIIAVIKKSKPLAKKASKVVFVYALGLVIFIVIEIVQSIRFDLIPQLSIDGDQMTIINYGTGSMGSRAEYVCSKEGIIEEIDTPYYWHKMSASMKFGFTFESRGAGDLFVVVAENDCADLSYADIYEVKVDQDGSMAAEKVEHIGPIIYRDKVVEFLEHLVDEYGFSREVLEENYGYYLN